MNFMNITKKEEFEVFRIVSEEGVEGRSRVYATVCKLGVTERPIVSILVKTEYLNNKNKIRDEFKKAFKKLKKDNFDYNKRPLEVGDVL